MMSDAFISSKCWWYWWNMVKVEICLWWSEAASQEEIMRDQQD